MNQVVRSQIAYLEELRQIFQNSYPDLTSGTHWNQYRIPYIDSQQEQMRDVIEGINGVVVEREKFYQELGNVMKELELLQTIVIPRGIVLHEEED